MGDRVIRHIENPRLELIVPRRWLPLARARADDLPDEALAELARPVPEISFGFRPA